MGAADEKIVAGPVAGKSHCILCCRFITWLIYLVLLLVLQVILMLLYSAFCRYAIMNFILTYFLWLEMQLAFPIYHV